MTYDEIKSTIIHINDNIEIAQIKPNWLHSAELNKLLKEESEFREEFDFKSSFNSTICTLFSTYGVGT